MCVFSLFMCKGLYNNNPSVFFQGTLTFAQYDRPLTPQCVLWIIKAAHARGRATLCWHDQFTSLQQNCRLWDQKKPQPLVISQRCIPLKASESSCATSIYLTLAQSILQINLQKIAAPCSQTRITLKNHLGVQSTQQWKEKHLLLNWAKCAQIFFYTKFSYHTSPWSVWGAFTNYIQLNIIQLYIKWLL